MRKGKCDNWVGQNLKTIGEMTMLVLLFAGSASAAILTVDDSGGAMYTRIQDAINASSDGDTIMVAPGLYTENVAVKRSISLIGAGSEYTTVRSTSSNNHVFNISVDRVNVSAFTILGATGSERSGINIVRSNYNNISDNLLRDNSNGILLSYSNGNILNNNIVLNNTYGINIRYSMDNILNGNNATLCYFTIYLYLSNNNTLNNNHALNSTDGIVLDQSSNNMLMDNIGSNNTYDGITLGFDSNNNTLTGNIASSNLRYGIIAGSSNYNNTFNGNNVFNNFQGIYLFGVNNSHLSSNSADSNAGYGIFLGYSSNNNTLNGNIARDNNWGIALSVANDTILVGNNLSSNRFDGIFLGSSTNVTVNGNSILNNSYGIEVNAAYNNSIYNNYFNNTDNFHLSNALFSNSWNFTKTPGTNIIGGFFISGNLWANPEGTGFSQTCMDSNRDGICDSKYTMPSYMDNTDYLPLAMPMGTIKGNVTNATDGSLISGAFVSLNYILYNATSYTDGNFTIYSVPTSSYFITTTASGYAPNITGINVTRGTNIRDIQLQQCRNIFSDVDCSYWGYMYIMTLYDRSVTSGYPDGTFKPENQITRAEIATFIVRAMGLTYSGSGQTDFPDVPTSHWAYNFVMAAKQNGIVSGYPDGTFKPDNQVSRAEISVMVTRAKSWTYSGGLSDFPDVPSSHWSYPYVMTVKEKNIVGGYPDGTFKPDNQATRAENSVMVTKMMLWE